MNLSRRLVCGTGVTLLAAPHLIGQGTAQDEISVTGHLSSQAATNVSGLEVRLSSVTGSARREIILDADGEIETTIAEPGTYRVTVFDYTGEFNELPDIYSFPDTDIGADGALGELTLPAAHRVDIRCLGPDGNPIEDLPVNFRAPNGTGMSPGTFTTTADGYVQYVGADEAGVELVDTVDIEVQVPSNPNNSKFIRTIDITEPQEIEVTISNPEQYTSRVQKVSKNPDAGFYFPYYLYTPSAAQVTDSGNETLDAINPRPLVVGFRTWGSAAERDERVADARAALTGGSKIRAIADELQTPAMVIPLPSSTDDRRFELLDRSSLRISEPPYERLDLQIFAMVDDARERLADQPYDIAETVHLDGFSNNDRLCDQLSILHPERINAVSGGGDGFHTIPKREYNGTIPVQSEPESTTLEWPVGAAGLEELIGKEFNKEAWLDTAFYYYIGGEDQGENDKSTLTNDYIHAKSYGNFGEKRQQLLVDIFGWDQVDERFAISRQIFETVGADATFKIYEGVGHTVTRGMVADITDFHRQQMVSTYPSGGLSSATDEGSDAKSTEPASDADSSETTAANGSGSGNDSTAAESESTTDSQPGFGLIHTVVTLGGIGYLLRNRIELDSD
jgi:hypothetical protein